MSAPWAMISLSGSGSFTRQSMLRGLASRSASA
jgi:hypothetical protein